MEFRGKFLMYLLYLIYFLYILAIFGVSAYAPRYIGDLRNIIKIYISLILIFRFNPIYNKRNHLSKTDKTIVFSAGCFLLLSTSLLSIIEYYVNKLLINTAFKRPIDKIFGLYNSSKNKSTDNP
jgi:hypothetical protein